MKWHYILIIYTIVLLSIFISAYCGYIPTQLNSIPYYDSIGHFLLYGTWGYLFAQTFSKPIFFIGRFGVQSGIVIAISIAIAEEALQTLSPLRSVSLFDLGWGLLGITIACIISNLTSSAART
jgi:polysaccharide biosynthesis protein VpsQ